MINKSFLLTAALLAGALLTAPAPAQVGGDDNVLAARGEGELTHEEFEARLNRVAPEHRFQFIRDRTRMEDVLDRLLLVNQLAADAKAEGFEADPVIQARMALAAKEELANAWIEYYVDQGKPADYETMAREEFKLNRDKYVTPHTVDVSHILVGTRERTDGEALALATELRARLDDEPEAFEALVMEYSDDPSKASNKGSFQKIGRGDMVESFEDAAFSMDVGALSDPVETPYGYHIIRKDGDSPPRQRRFNEVRLSLEQQMRKRHRDRARREYLATLYEPDMEVTQESVENAIERVFGPEVLAKYAEDVESQGESQGQSQ